MWNLILNPEYQSRRRISHLSNVKFFPVPTRSLLSSFMNVEKLYNLIKENANSTQSKIICTFIHLGTTISKFYVSQEGVPFFVLNNNDAFVFSRNLSSWYWLLNWLFSIIIYKSSSRNSACFRLSLNLGLGILNELLKNMEFITKLVPNGLLATLCPFFRDLKNKY